MGFEPRVLELVQGLARPLSDYHLDLDFLQTSRFLYGTIFFANLDDAFEEHFSDACGCISV